MKITFIGATHEVTGSCTLLEAGGHKILIDCGMEQGKDVFENIKLPVSPAELDCVLLTHAHMDHSGRLPVLARGGFTGSVYATGATCSLTEIMLMDSTHIQEFEAEWRNRKAKRAGSELYVPEFERRDTEEILRRLRPCDYGIKYQVLENMTVRFIDAGHLLGSASIEVTLSEGNVTKKLIFSGDIGNLNKPIINDPQNPGVADYVVMESTYGDRLHEPHDDHSEKLAKLLNETFKRGGNVVVPSFAVGRTQEMLYDIRRLRAAKMVDCDFTVYLDSPLANDATSIFMQSDISYFDPDAAALVREGINPFWFDGLKLSETAEQSKMINTDYSPKVIISASGMCDAGRIRHHLKHNLWRPESLILFVGYQAEGTLGRILLDGKDSHETRCVKLFGEQIEVKAKIEYLPGMSGHADREGLLQWIEALGGKPARVFVNHGDDKACVAFRDKLVELGYTADAPYSGTSFDLLSGEYVELTDGNPIKTKTATNTKSRNAFSALLSAAEDLLGLVRSCEGRANRELAAFTSQILELIKKHKN